MAGDEVGSTRMKTAARRNAMPTFLARFARDRACVEQGDITLCAVDAIVNAANSRLAGGGGVDGAIHRAGGPAIMAACRELRRTKYPDGLPTGEVAATTAGNLAARHVIHTVGPIYGNHGGREPELLSACYRNALQLAADSGWSSIAFPAISTGVYGYPREAAAVVASTAIEDFLRVESRIDEIRLVFYLPEDAEIFVAHQKFSS
jgi:O-acetyl-ADP-ribose deacetylase (regulator of RNase III)